MVQKTIRAITTKISGLGEAAFWLSVFAFFSQILALLRDRLLAYHFGASSSLDIYYAAFKIPDIIFVTAASIVSISALVPLFAKKETEGEKHFLEATSSIFTVFSIMICVISVITWILMPKIISLAFGGFSYEIMKKTITLSRLLLLSPLLLGFSNFFGSIVQYEKRFILYSLSPLLYNIGIILGIVVLVEDIGIMGPIIGVIFGALMHLLLQAIFVIFSPRRPKFTKFINWKVVFETAQLSIPRTFALSIASFTALFFAALSSRLGGGSVAVFNLSWNLQSVPLSLIGVSFSLAAFPALAISAAQRNSQEVSERIASGLSSIVFWSLPITFLFVVLRAHIVRVVLGSGLFDWEATRLVAASLSVFVVSTVFQSMQLFLTRSHYALGRTKWPLVGNFIAGVSSIFIALICYLNYQKVFPLLNSIAKFLKVDELPFEILIIPFSYSIGCLLGVLVLFFALKSEYWKKIWAIMRRGVFESLVASLLGGFAAYFTLSITSSIFNLDTFLGVFGHSATSFVIGVVVWAISLYCIENPDFMGFIKMFREKFKSARKEQ